MCFYNYFKERFNIMKILSKKFISVLLTLLIICSSISVFGLSASAYSTWNNSKMINGVGQSGNLTRYYWYDTTSLNSTWKSRVENAMYAWCHTGSEGCGTYTSVWFKSTTTKSSSVIDFYASNNLGNGVYGLTSLYTGTGANSVQVFPHSTPTNWVWAKIELATNTCDTGTYKLTTVQKKAMIEHEIGHAFGLAHTSNSSVLMYPYADVCTATEPKNDDCNGVNYLYGGYNP